jgi:phosphoserine phosphatase RsbU/P
LATPGLYIAAAGEEPRVIEQCFRAVLGAWPGSALPDLRRGHLHELVTRLEESGESAEPFNSAVLVVIGPGEPAGTIDRLSEAMAWRQVPGVILIRDPSAWQIIQRHGVIFERSGADAARIAGMLFALIERESAVRLLQREVGLAQRSSGGVQVEMDRLQEELYLAAAIQRDFTASPVPDLPGMDIAVLYRPMSYVSGDVYAVRERGAARAEFFVADAVGHGVPAALLTMVLTTSLAAATGDGGAPDPAEVLSRLNHRLCASCLGTGRFVTAVYGIIDASCRSVTLAGAGHPLPILLSPSGSREIETSGPLLGVFAEAEFDQQVITLGEDDTLMLYTDGLDAAFPAAATGSRSAPIRRDRWISELCGAISESAGPRVPALLTELQHRLDMQAGSLHGGDDVTALCMAPRRGAA